MSEPNVTTGFGAKVHRGKRVPFVLHSRYGKIPGPVLIPACMSIRLRLSLDHVTATDDGVTCEKCGGKV